jgi:hypothetical protein
VDADGSTAAHVTVRFTGAEALVLVDALSAWQQSGALPGDDPATRRVLTDLLAVIEPLDDFAFAPDYAERLHQARASVLGS